jgi:hypothetical protein
LTLGCPSNRLIDPEPRRQLTGSRSGRVFHQELSHLGLVESHLPADLHRRPTRPRRTLAE